MRNYKAYCFDLDGTVYRGTEPVPEAVELIGRLQANGVDPYFITNNSSMTPFQIKEKLGLFGVQTQIEKIVTSAVTAAHYCRQLHEGATVMMIGEDGLREALETEGFRLVEGNPDIVVMGIDRRINYEKLSSACIAIRRGAHFIATNSDKAIPTEKGLLPGNGSFVKLVENATDKTPVFVGKPQPHMLEFIQKSGGYSKDEMVMIGDNYDTDILFGLDFGIDTIHVEGGVTSRAEMLLKARRPTKLVKTLKCLEI